METDTNSPKLFEQPDVEEAPRPARRRAMRERSAVKLPALLDIEGVATQLGFTTRHVYRLVGRKQIPHLKLGHLLRFDPDQIAEWLKQAERPVVERR